MIGWHLADQEGNLWQITWCWTSEAANYDGEYWYDLYRILDRSKPCFPWDNQDARMSVLKSRLEAWHQKGQCNYWEVPDECTNIQMLQPCMPVVVTVADPQKIKNRYFRTLTNGDLEVFLPVAGVTARTKHELYPLEFEEAVVHYLECFIGTSITDLKQIDYDGYASRMTDSRGRPWE